MNKSKQSAPRPALRVIAPYTLEECLARLDDLRLSHERYLAVRLTYIDDDHINVELRFRSSSFVGYFKRWDTISTLVVASPQLPFYRSPDRKHFILVELMHETFGEDYFERSDIENEMAQRAPFLAHHLRQFMTRVRSRHRNTV